MVCQQHIQAAQTGLCMLASIKKWVNIHYGKLAHCLEQAKFMVVYAILLAILPALSVSPANKSQQKFQPRITF